MYDTTIHDNVTNKDMAKLTADDAFFFFSERDISTLKAQSTNY